MVEQMSNPFDIIFVEEDEVPDAPRKSSRNDALWVAAKEILNAYPGQFAKVKQFESVTGAAQKASAINNNKNKQFPSADYEARYTSDADKGTSTLYLAARESAE
jgi:hypothetical protein